MKLKKRIDTNDMVSEFLKKNSVKECPDFKSGFDKPLNSRVDYKDNYSYKGGNIPRVNGRNYDPDKEKEHITGVCKACKKPSVFYVSDWRKSKSNRKRYSAVCPVCKQLDGGVVKIMSTFNNVEEYDEFVSRHGVHGAYVKYTLDELLVMRVEAQNHSDIHTQNINKVINSRTYKKDCVTDKTTSGNYNVSVLGHEFDF